MRVLCDHEGSLRVLSGHELGGAPKSLRTAGLK